MAIHLTPEANPTVQEGTLYVDSATGEFNVAGRTTPHIIPGVLYPAYVASGTSPKLLDGTTTHGTGTYNGVAVSTAYGTVQADGRKYYYTNIAGSKPIKDPRIGGHFGSQRHVFTSLQLLQQETATYGDDVFSLDGREWLRAVGSAWYMANDATGAYLRLNNSSYEFVEITGYFNDVNMFFHTSSDSPDAIDVFVDGTENATTNISAFKTSVNTPLGQRYVNAGSLHNIGLQSTSLGIHTIKLIMLDTGHTAYCRFSGIELIAQDTTSTANRSKIQIPSQDVVSYGKKFTVSGTPHYDPFSAKTDGSAWTSPTSGTNNANSSASWPTNIDTATSLGLDKWVDGSNYYRPYNGARVVHWVDSSGTIKTSVTVMPPNAKSIKSADVNKKAKNAPNDTYLPTFEDETTDVNEDNLHEVAKTFHWREFGNGSANGNTSYQDASTLNADGNFAYVMDDGLSSYIGSSVISHSGSSATGGSTPNRDGTGDYTFTTFIGTGFSWANGGSNIQRTMSQNLPYGTHIIKCIADGSSTSELYIDGIILLDADSTLDTHSGSEFSVYQPKRPPIPKDACVLADYMLMADFVKRTPAINDPNRISKGVRLVSASRDIFYDSAGSASTNNMKPMIEAWLYNAYTGFSAMFNGATNQDSYAQLPYFGATEGDFVTRAVGDSAKLTVSLTNSSGSLETSNVTLTSNTTISSQPTIPEGGSDSASHHTFVKSDGVLGSNTVKFLADGQNSSTNYDWLYMAGLTVATPIHTSSHYQTFETPYLHELIGGDRNMEQTNLVVSPDGKTWDQLTRDTSYIGNGRVLATTDTAQTSHTDVLVMDEHRGTFNTLELYNKDFAIAYDRFICLKAGTYKITSNGTTNYYQNIVVNGNTIVRQDPNTAGVHSNSFSVNINLIRGDYVQKIGGNQLISGHDAECSFLIEKI